MLTMKEQLKIPGVKQKITPYPPDFVLLMSCEMLKGIERESMVIQANKGVREGDTGWFGFLKTLGASDTFNSDIWE